MPAVSEVQLLDSVKDKDVIKNNSDAIKRIPFHYPKNRKKPLSDGYHTLLLKQFSDKIPWAAKTTRKQDLAAKANWIKQRYEQLKSDKSLSKYSVRYEKIADEIVGMQFGNLKITKSPAISSIKGIIYS